MSKKQYLAGIAGALSLLSVAFAGDFGQQPIAYEEQVKDYFADRLKKANGARFDFTSEPYPVYIDVKGYENLPCWAVDVRVKARMRNGAQDGYVPYTVVFYNGQPVALSEDVKDFQLASWIDA